MQNYVLGKRPHIVPHSRTKPITHLVNTLEAAGVMLTIEGVAQIAPALPGFQAFREYYSTEGLQGIIL